MLQTHLALSECVSFIKLVGIMDMELESPVHVVDEEGDPKEATMSICSILVGIEIISSELPKAIVSEIAKSRGGEYEGILPTCREREAEAAKIATHVASAIMYRLMFHLDTKPDNIAEFIRVRFLEEYVKVAMMHSSYKMETGTVTLHQTSNQNNDDDMQDMVGEDWVNMSILESEVILDIGAMDSGVIFDHNDNISLSSVNTKG